MSHLHTINAPELLELCLRVAKAGDSLLFIENGVYCATQPQLTDRMQGLSVYVLQEDLLARGLEGRITEAVVPVSRSEFVGLCCRHPKIINWF